MSWLPSSARRRMTAFGIRAFGHVFHDGGRHLVTELLDHVLAALFVGIGPAVITDGAEIDKGNLQRVRGKRR